MRRHMLKTAALLMFGCLLSFSSFAQSAKKSTGKTIVKDETVVIKNSDGSGRTVVEIRDGNIYVNGRSIMSVRDDDAARVHKKIIIENGEAGDHADIYPDLNRTAGAPRALLGVMTDPNSDEAGALVKSVRPGSAAEAAGLKSGDLITGVDDQAIKSSEALVTEIQDEHDPGDRVSIRYRRDGREYKTEARLGKTGGYYFGPAFPFPPGNRDEFMPDELFQNPPLGGRGFFHQGPTLGVSVEDRADGQGVQVLSVQPGSAAATAGLRSGDVITRFGSKDIHSVFALQSALRNTDEGEKVSMEFQRGGTTMSAELSFPKPLKRKDL